MLKTHSHCLMCGEHNPLSLGLKFSSDEAGGVTASFRGNAFLQGYDGMLHGGIISGLLDAAMVHCLFQQGISAVTGELNIKFLAPIPYNCGLTLRAWLLSKTPPLYELKAELIHAGQVMARAESKFMRRV
jgi:acyl-coenzyme A thioesterase PaaI-like protein